MLPRLVRLGPHAALLDGHRFQAAHLDLVGDGTEHPAIAIEVLGLAVADNCPEEAMRQPLHQLGPIALQRGHNRFGLPEGRGKRSDIGHRLAQLLEARGPGRAGEARRLLLERVLRFGRLGLAKSSIDADSPGRREAGGDALGVEPLPVLQGTGVVAGIVRQQTAQEELPFEERQGQADRLQRGPGLVVAARLAVRERFQDGREGGVLFGRKPALAGRPFPHRAVGDMVHRALAQLRVGVGAERLQGPTGITAVGESFGQHCPEFRGTAHGERVAKDDRGVAGMALLLKLSAAFEQNVAQQFLVFRCRFLLEKLAREFQGLLRSTLGTRRAIRAGKGVGEIFGVRATSFSCRRR